MSVSRQRDGTWAGSVPAIPDEIVWVEVDGETVVYEERRKQVHVLNPSATLVWNAIDGRAPLGRIAGELSEALGAENDTVLADVLGLAGELRELGLLVLATPRR